MCYQQGLDNPCEGLRDITPFAQKPITEVQASGVRGVIDILIGGEVDPFQEELVEDGHGLLLRCWGGREGGREG